MQLDTQTALLWIVLLPLLGAIINGLFVQSVERKLAQGIAVGAVAGSFLLAILCFLEVFQQSGAGVENPAITFELYEWFNLSIGPFTGAESTVPLRVAFTLDSLSSVMCLVVTGIGLLIHIYSTGYMDTEKSYARFFAYLNLFMASMLILIMGTSLPVLFVGWEGVGLCSYLLIGFWYENPDYAQAGKKAFIANRIGDFGVLIGMFILLLIAHSVEFQEINALAEQGLGAFHAVDPNLVNIFGLELDTSTLITVACLFLFLGCCGKSAQIPLYVWLPDAMAGPTPVSALIHAATMVTAGIYLCCRLSALFVLSPTTLSVIAIIGTLTALMAATIAVVQNEMKKILAYSTVSQLGFMFAAVGVGAFAAGFFHVFTHAFFKACLFLGAGAVMHAVHAHGDADIRKLGGLKKLLPKTHWTFLVSCAAIAGFPLTSGFFSKDEILLGATSIAYGGEGQLLPGWVGHFVFVGLFIAATMTAFYMFRLYFLTFTGEYRSAGHGDDEHGDAHDDHGHGYAAHPHANGANITIPLAILGVGAVVVGFLGMPHIVMFSGADAETALHLPNWWSGWMSASVATPVAHDNMTAVNAAGIGGLLAAGFGIAGAYVLYNGKNEDTFTTKIPGPIHRFLFDKWRVDELYAIFPLGFIAWLSRFSGRFDAIVVDGLLTKVTSRGVQAFGWLVTRTQTGVVYVYGATMVVGVLGGIWWFTFPHPGFEVEVQGNRAQFTAESGFGYEYRWDYDNADDHAFETDWSDEVAGSFRYEDGDFHAFGVSTPVPGFLEPESWRLDAGDEHPIPSYALPPGWSGEDDEEATPPQFEVSDEGELFFRPNGASRYSVLGGPVQMGSEPIALRAGQTLQVMGESRPMNFTISAFARATLQVRNSFGHQASCSQEVEVTPNAPTQALNLGGRQ